MPYTVRISGDFARYLLSNPDAELRRRIELLQLNPFPPGSHSLEANAEWHAVAARVRGLRAFVYGTAARAIVYSVSSKRGEMIVEFAIVNGVPTP